MKTQIKNQIAELEEKAASLRSQIEVLEKEQNNLEIDPDDYTEVFDDSLDSEGPVYIAGYEFNVSYALKKLDEIAYREGLNNFVDSCYSVSDLEEWRDMQGEIEDLETELCDIENEIEDFYSQIENLEDDE